MKKLREIKIKPILLGIFLVYVTVAFFDQLVYLRKKIEDFLIWRRIYYINRKSRCCYEKAEENKD